VLYALVAAFAQNAGAARSTRPPVLYALVAAFAQNAGGVARSTAPPCSTRARLRARGTRVGWRLRQGPRALREHGYDRAERGWGGVFDRAPVLCAFVAAVAQTAGAARSTRPPVLYASTATIAQNAGGVASSTGPPCSARARLRARRPRVMRRARQGPRALREHGYDRG
jgi:hypothetical protein